LVRRRVGRLDEALCVVVERRRLLLRRHNDRRQAVDLRDIKDAVIPHHSDLLFLVLLLYRELAGEDDVSAFLALADVRAESERLAERHPRRVGISGVFRGMPEDGDVDPAVGAARGDIGGQQPERGAPLRPPRLHPCGDAFLQVVDDAARTALVRM
jgi:hypothetical protein